MDINESVAVLGIFPLTPRSLSSKPCDELQKAMRQDPGDIPAGFGAYHGGQRYWARKPHQREAGNDPCDGVQANRCA